MTTGGPYSDRDENRTLRAAVDALVARYGFSVNMAENFIRDLSEESGRSEVQTALEILAR